MIFRAQERIAVTGPAHTFSQILGMSVIKAYAACGLNTFMTRCLFFSLCSPARLFHVCSVRV